ncbi:recombinase family protein [Streptomyces sp. NPDC005917]|uniref:recombinase family protein n=1 Tax=unclassified Streptomyces TaxID=2593676 RepID=UPI00340A1335
MTTMTDTLTGREILRVSQDHSGEERSNEEQHDENAEATARHGIALVGDSYRDVGSASDYAKKKIRDGFGQLIADLESGDFGADVLVMWENSRASRQPREWIKVADACRDRGVKIFITTQHRNPLFDPRDPRDYADLIDEAVKAMRASAETSKRVIRALNANLNHDSGAKPQGQIPFGYKREYAMTKVNGRTAMRPVGQQPDPETAPLVIELFQRVKAGHSFLSIARDWAERGILNKSGGTHSAQHLRSICTRKAYVAIRIHKVGDVITELPASWPVIADFTNSPMTPDQFVALFAEVGVILADGSRKSVSSRPGTGQHAFTQTIRCGECGGPLRVSENSRESRYICRLKGCVSIAKAPVDDVLNAEITTYLARPEVYEAITPGDSGELDAVRAQLAVKGAQLAAFEDEDPETPAELRMIAKKIDKLEGEITALEARETELTPRPSELAGLFDYGPDVAARWKAKPADVRRKIAALLLAPDALGEVRINRAGGTESASDRIRCAADRIKWAVTETPAEV